MNGQQSPSSPRSSTSSRPLRGNIAQHISDEIKAAIKATTAGVPESLVQSKRFLPKGDLQTILNLQILKSYLRELFASIEESRQAPEEGAWIGGGHEPMDLDALIDNALTLIAGDTARGIPSRRALLALFLYQRRTGLLAIFKSWLLSKGTKFPSDDDLPFSQQRLEQENIPNQYHDYINDYQSIFTPVVLRKGQNQTFTSKDRLPYIGAHLAEQEGSSGIVYTRKVAPYHWEIQLDNGGYIPAETRDPMILALKVFNGGRSGQEARADFEIERKILEDLRNSNFAHRMILLHWGSITIQDEQGPPIYHSLIFECATYSLEEFLMGEKGVELSWTASLLLAKLVDIVQALACLHDNFDTLHLDIKPDNILVFEKTSSANFDFEWKISDFGLARKRTAKPRAGHLLDLNRSTSKSASLLATRNAGRYQAPEIQQRKSSKAGQKSDVWSMGCVALMVTGFMIDGSKRVTDLTNRLQVEYKNNAGYNNLFYVTNDSWEWRYIADFYHYNYSYLNEHKPAPGAIPGMPELEASVHPHVVEWSNSLYRYCHDKPEQPILKSLLETIFLGVLLIDMNARIKAGEFCRRLLEIKEDCKRMEESPEGSLEAEETTNQRVAMPAPRQDNTVKKTAGDPQRHRIVPAHVNESHQQHIPEQRNINDGNDKEPSVENLAGQSEDRTLALALPHQAASRIEEKTRNSTEDAIIAGLDIATVSGPPRHSKLCAAIVKMTTTSDSGRLELKGEIQSELHRDSHLVRRPCPRPNCQRHPIHVAIRHKSYEALNLLLDEADLSDLNIPCPGCEGRTAVEQACEKPGDIQALNLFKKHFSEFSVTKEFYDSYKNRVSRWARDTLKELSETPVQRSLLQRVLTSNTNRSV